MSSAGPPAEGNLKRGPSASKPKGILKNAPPPPGAAAQHLQWDEENIALTELQKDSQMKITEPKTPYVRYNAELDDVEGDIPTFDLGRSSAPSPPPATPSPIEPPSPRRASFSAGKRPGRSSSGSSSRSTSFSLPSDFPRGEVQEASSDEEVMSPEAAAKHEAFLKARGRHYSNEAEAMKRAAKLMEEDDDDSQGEGVQVPPVRKVNGTGSQSTGSAADTRTA
ncbi:hypothetical protein F5148DRAFT_1214450 [Russula earlei]|uniref:Uncharacterized protein n=1 Tax=Russula earlei TaxID=71964 RepID=A0ACC0U5F0_9AGAM|nr:hypothetical protein F5148DRAFT_1214450 [Russula earlei]